MQRRGRGKDNIPDSLSSVFLWVRFLKKHEYFFQSTFSLLLEIRYLEFPDIIHMTFYVNQLSCTLKYKENSKGHKTSRINKYPACGGDREMTSPQIAPSVTSHRNIFWHIFPVLALRRRKTLLHSLLEPREKRPLLISHPAFITRDGAKRKKEEGCQRQTKTHWSDMYCLAACPVYIHTEYTYIRPPTHTRKIVIHITLTFCVLSCLC